jgi:hypothetical protein
MSPARNLPWVWGATVAEVDVRYPCDEFAADGSVRVTRAVTAHASASSCFVWLCQLRRAPYSYDLIDNAGRRSPRTPDGELTQLQLGQRFMTIFTLVAFDRDSSITLRMSKGWPRRLFGAITLTYQLEEQDGQTRLIAAMRMPPIGHKLAGMRRRFLAWGDLVMMRKQLLLLASLAERETWSARDPVCEVR